MNVTLEVQEELNDMTVGKTRGLDGFLSNECLKNCGITAVRMF